MEILIVLGNRNNKIMKKRVDCAIKDFLKTPSEHISEEMTNNSCILKYILFSGGSNDGVSKPEGAIMMDEYACGKIDKKFIKLEILSKTTIENLVNSKEMIEEFYGKIGIPSTYDCLRPNICICTSTFHIRRAIILSQLIFSGYNIRYIHTEEDISEDEIKRENINLSNAIDRYCNYKLN